MLITVTIKSVISVCVTLQQCSVYIISLSYSLILNYLVFSRAFVSSPDLSLFFFLFDV